MVLKRNLPSSFSARLNPWEEANKPAPSSREPPCAGGRMTKPAGRPKPRASRARARPCRAACRKA